MATRTKTAHRSAARPVPAARPVTVLIGTRKGAFILKSDRGRERWKVAEPLFLGHIVHHVVQDPRDPRVLLVAARTGHLGPTVFRSTDAGRAGRRPRSRPRSGRRPVAGWSITSSG